MARRSLKLPLLIALTAIVLVAIATIWTLGHRSGPGSAPAPSKESLAPEGTRVRVQVVNASTVRGLARRATQALRDRGFDVVEAGTGTEQLDSTVVIDRSGHPDWAKRVAAALGGARIETRPDSSRYLDITVLVGRTWRAPAQPFYP